ncbi:MAG: sigma-70 family RNA polymerase sigma factor [Chitinivibrionales bacterium]|nr:sigma-70 family RNA polymerase sigma factor [Chitinivibrionales bacterium]
MPRGRTNRAAYQVVPGRLGSYLRDISRCRVLSPDEEKRLAVRIRKGDKRALETLVCANLRFVVSVARNYQGQGVPLEDLINDGNIGLIRAAQRFDDRKNFKFISYAVWWIRQAILQGLAKQSRSLRLPLNQVGIIYRVGRARERLEQRYMRTPDDDEISIELGMKPGDLNRAMQVAGRTASLDAPVGARSETPRAQLLPDDETDMPDDVAGDRSVKQKVHSLLRSNLSRREREVIARYYGIGRDAPSTLDEIGQQLCLTRERVRQVKEKALSKLSASDDLVDMKESVL